VGGSKKNGTLRRRRLSLADTTRRRETAFGDAPERRQQAYSDFESPASSDEVRVVIVGANVDVEVALSVRVARTAVSSRKFRMAELF
jgi:hypothetical protein